MYLFQNVNTSNPLPVMVWIYGGGFVGGSNNPSFTGADYLVDQELVFVSVNYRVSALGKIEISLERGLYQ